MCVCMKQENDDSFLHKFVFRTGPTGGLWGLSQPPNLQKFRFFCSTIRKFSYICHRKRFTHLKNRKIQLSSPKNFAAAPPPNVDRFGPALFVFIVIRK